MSFFNAAEPVIQNKQEALDVQDLRGLLRIHFEIGKLTLFSAFYTRIDQAFILWGLITAIIFVTAQFLPVSWYLQAIIWSIFTLGGVLGMIVLTWFWVTVERLRWIVYCWATLMLLGVALTDFGIFTSCGPLLINLCPLWLGLSAIGYIYTGLGMRSRTFVFAAIFHLVGIPILSYLPAWQFLATGSMMATSLILLANVQWDMRPPIDFNLLTVEQRQFNQQQHQLRQVALQNS